VEVEREKKKERKRRGERERVEDLKSIFEEKQLEVSIVPKYVGCAIKKWSNKTVQREKKFPH
jgi:hypothetical protein